jgi:IclR family KDG regulon transcriptional repressor
MLHNIQKEILMVEGKIIKSVDHALQVLELFSAEKQDWGVTEISEALNLYKSTVFDILKTFENRGLMKKDEKTQKYQLEIKLMQVISAILNKMNLKQVALPFMEKLSKKYDESVHLTIVVDNKALPIMMIESTKLLRSFISLGESVSLYCTASGKIVLAHWPDEKVADYLQKHELKKNTETTITDINVLKQELNNILKSGYAVNNSEHEAGIKCVAGPIMDFNGKVLAAISVTGPAMRMDELVLSDIAKDVVEYCKAISDMIMKY